MADDGTSITQNVNGDAGARYYGFYTCGYTNLEYIDVTAESAASGFAVGEFGLARAPRLIQRGDVNCDGRIDFDDIDPFVAALGGADGYYDAYPCCFRMSADTNCDGVVDFDDIDPFVACLSAGYCACQE